MWDSLNNRWPLTHGFGSERVELRSTEREQYFVHPDPNDTTLYLEALGISHTPNSISVGSWGRDEPLTNQSELTVDYIRVFQPRNRYADMEPLYE